MLRQALCVCECFSRVSWRSASRPAVTCVGDNAGLFSDARAICAFGGLSANQRRRDKILFSSCAVAKSPSDHCVIADHSSVPHEKAWEFNGKINGPLYGAAITHRVPPRKVKKKRVLASDHRAVI